MKMSLDKVCDKRKVKKGLFGLTVQRDTLRPGEDIKVTVRQCDSGHSIQSGREEIWTLTLSLFSSLPSVWDTSPWEDSMTFRVNLPSSATPI